MHLSKNIFLGLTSLACLTLGNDLLAQQYVTISSATGEGSLSNAIDAVNLSPEHPLIFIKTGVTPTLTSFPFPTIETSMTIGSDVQDSTRSIDLNDVSAGFNVAAGRTIFTKDIFLLNAKLLITNNAILEFGGPNNYANNPAITLATADLDFSFPASQPSTQVFSGTISVETEAKIGILSSYDTVNTLNITGEIVQTTPSSVIFSGGSKQDTIILNNTNTINSWTLGTSIDGVSLIVETSNSFPNLGSINLTADNSFLSFLLGPSDSYVGTCAITGSLGYNTALTLQSGIITLSESIQNLRRLNYTGGTVDLSGSLSNIDTILVDNTTDTNSLTLSGSIINSPILIRNGTLTLEGNNATNRQDITLQDGTANLTLGGLISPESTMTSKDCSGNIIANITVDLSIWELSHSTTYHYTHPSDTMTINTLTVSDGPSTLTLSGPGVTVIPLINLRSDSTSAATLTVNGSLGGSSGLTLTGQGVVTLTSSSTYTGSTFVGTAISDAVTLNMATTAQIGTVDDFVNINTNSYLVNNGIVLASNLTNNGTLSGIGQIHGTLVTNYGTTAPGNSPGNLTIIGNFTSSPGSFIQTAINAEEASLLTVSETLTLNPDVTLKIVPELGCYKSHTSFAILHAEGSLVGTFSDVQLDSLLLTPTLTYGSHGVILDITRGNLADIGFQGNALEIAKAVDSLIAQGHSLCAVIGDFILSSKEEIAAALESLQPSLFKGLTISQENNAVKVQDSLGYRMQVELDSMHCHSIKSNKDEIKSTCKKEKKPFQVWLTGMGDALHQSKMNTNGSPHIGYHETIGGVVLGADYHFAKHLYAGLLGAYTSSDIKWNDNLGKGDIQSAYTGLYFSAQSQMFYGNISILGALNHFDAHRNIDLPSGTFKAKNKHGGAQLLSHADTGINLGWGGFTIRPFDSFDYITQTENAYTEKGAGDLNLSIKESNAIMLRNELGLNFAYCLCHKKNKWIISPKISWIREVRIKGAKSTATFVDTDTPFTVTGFFPDRSLVSPGISLTGTTLNDRLSLEIYYNGEFDGNYSDHSFGGQIRVSF